MNRPRSISRSLTGTRIYARGKNYFYFSKEPMLNPKTGKLAKWHILCPLADGELKARQEKEKMLGSTAPKGIGDFGAWFGKWIKVVLVKRMEIAPTDPPRRVIWDEGTKTLLSVLSVIDKAFADFDVAQVEPADCWTFLEQWDGRRSGQVYRGHLNKFFVWCIKKNAVRLNPVLHFSMETPQKRDVYFSDESYKAIREAMSDDHNGKMARGYMDLLYLFYSRGTDVRLIRKDQFTEQGIKFKPTKTERTSGAKVIVPVSDQAREVIEWLKSITTVKSMYLFHNRDGEPLTAREMGKEFRKACRKCKINGVTLKDIRAKAATDAKKLGYSNNQIQTALAHADGSTTRDYVRSREVPVSEVILRLPK